MSKKIRKTIRTIRKGKTKKLVKRKSVVGFTEKVVIYGPNKKKELMARIDTGAAKNSIDVKLAAELKLGPIIKTKRVRSAEGLSERPLIKVALKICDRKFKTLFNLADRTKLRYKVLIGRNILKQNFVIDPNYNINKKYKQQK